MGLFAVAHLAVRHGIKVTLSTPPGGGTTAEVCLPAALISLDAKPGGWPGQAGEALQTGRRADEEADAWVAAAELAVLRLRFAAGPEPPWSRNRAGAGDRHARDAVPLTAGRAGAIPGAASPGGTAPEPVGAEPGGVLPIFESVESGYDRGHAPAQRSTDRPLDAGGAACRSAASLANRRRACRGRALGVGGPASSGLPQRIPQASHVRGAAVDQGTRQATAAESAEITRSRLASFQRGSRRARATAQMDRGTKQPAQDG